MAFGTDWFSLVTSFSFTVIAIVLTLFAFCMYYFAILLVPSFFTDKLMSLVVGHRTVDLRFRKIISVILRQNILKVPKEVSSELLGIQTVYEPQIDANLSKQSYIE